MRFDFIIGNPPYGVAANMAVKFLNKSTELSDDVRMVLPASFQRDSVLNRINLDYELVYDERLPDDTFPRDITTVFQQWKRAEEPREKIVIFREHPDFELSLVQVFQSVLYCQFYVYIHGWCILN